MGYGDDQRGAGYDAAAPLAAGAAAAPSNKRRRDAAQPQPFEQQLCMQQQQQPLVEQSISAQQQGSEAIAASVEGASGGGGAAADAEHEVVLGTALDAQQQQQQQHAAPTFELTAGVGEDMHVMQEQLNDFNKLLDGIDDAVVRHLQAMLDDWRAKLAEIREAISVNAQECAAELVQESDLTRRAEAQRERLGAAVRALQAQYESFEGGGY